MSGVRAVVSTDKTDEEASAAQAVPASPSGERRRGGRRWMILGSVSAVITALGAAAGYFTWQDISHQSREIAISESVIAAKDTTVAMLSYKPETAAKDLNAARDRLTGAFEADYTKLISEVVIPGATEKKISAVAQVAAAGSVLANGRHAVVLLFVDQTVVMGKGAPTNTASSVRVTLEKIGQRWLVSGFEPV